MSILDTLALARLLRPGAQWLQKQCATCDSFDYIGRSTDGVRHLRELGCDGCDNACPAWQRKED